MKKYVMLTLVTLLFISINTGCDTTNQFDSTSNNSIKQVEHKVLICDGITVIENCEIDGIKYSKYKYYPAVLEKNHVETKTTYVQEVAGYCTLCNDGTRSPTCATGRGTCSHHGGVRTWNAPIYVDVPKYEQVTVIDSPAIAEYYEKILK